MNVCFYRVTKVFFKSPENLVSAFYRVRASLSTQCTLLYGRFANRVVIQVATKPIHLGIERVTRSLVSTCLVSIIGPSE